MTKNNLGTDSFAIIGFGNQASAWAMNLRDQKTEVTIYLKPASKSLTQVQNLKFKHEFLGHPIKHKQIALLIPDHEHENFLVTNAKFIQSGTKIIYGHGHSLWHGRLHEKYPQFEHLLLAPKAIASELRFNFETKKALAGVYSAEFSASDENKNFLKLLGSKLGLTHLFETPTEAETKSDLLSEQALLCGLYPMAILECYNLLRKNGVPKEAAFFECWHESLLIMKAFITHGPEKFFTMISPNALYGATLGEASFKKNYVEQIQKLYANIENGTFDHEAKKIDYHKLREDILARWKKEEIAEVFIKLKGLY